MIMSNFVFTCGDINGIGPEIVFKSLNKLTSRKNKDQYFFICPANVFSSIFKKINPHFEYLSFQKLSNIKNTSKVNILLLPDFKVNIGKPTKESGEASFEALKLSYQLLKRKICDAVITAPVSKTALHLAGKKFPGQTEMFSEWSGTENFLMVFLSRKLNISLNSIHIPLKNVSLSLNKKDMTDSLNVLIKSLKNDLSFVHPKIAVLGLNPHAGESGIIGKEENEIIIPVIRKFSKSINIEGPFSPDAYFANRMFENFDMTFAMYHDQALIPFKFINFGKGVNFTAGLPIVRTSPDHGVAYDIAGKNLADEGSILQAFYYAKKIVNNRKHEKVNKRSSYL
jgi:4-hydroxythreonine-4-phosphate dehydrogenase